MITVACVLKGGGDFEPCHAQWLQANVRQYLADYSRFVCLTDCGVIRGVETVPLVDDLPGWWSKMELFRLSGPLLYLDLDTMITGDISALALALARLSLQDPRRFMMLRRFRQQGWASGIMGWAGDWSWVLRQFLRETGHGRHFTPGPKGWSLEYGTRSYSGDQQFISAAVKTDPGGSWPLLAAQDLLPGIVSYRHGVRRQGLNDDVRIVCFHGYPRPWDLDYALPKVRRGAQKR